MTALHLTAAIASLLIGALVLMRRKGTWSHKLFGRIWVGLMATAAISSFWLLGLNKGSFSWIHILSVWTLVSLSLAIYFIRRGNVRSHKRFMIGTFVGLLAAGVGAMAPGRTLYLFFFA
jgi:uncharacterized membrane protein